MLMVTDRSLRKMPAMSRKFWQDPVPCGECESCKAGATEWCPDLRPQISADETAWMLAQWPCTDPQTRARNWAGFEADDPQYYCGQIRSRL